MLTCSLNGDPLSCFLENPVMINDYVFLLCSDKREKVVFSIDMDL